MANEIKEKYEQMQVLIPSDKSGYYLTEPPSMSDIDNKLYQCVKKDELCNQHTIGDQWLETCQTLPFVHQRDEPTLKDILDYLPYYSEYSKVYIFYTPMNYTIGDFHVSSLMYAIQKGVWKQKDNEISTGSPIKPDIMVRQVPLMRPVIANGELLRRYEQVIPVSIGSNNVVVSVDKPQFSQIHKIAYLWDKKNAQTIGTYDRTSKNIVTSTGELFAHYIGTIPTFHTWSYYGFFKPSLDEVLIQLPEIPAVCLVTTDIPHESLDKMCFGDYHVGATTIWQLV